MSDAAAFDKRVGELIRQQYADAPWMRSWMTTEEMLQHVSATWVTFAVLKDIWIAVHKL